MNREILFRGKRADNKEWIYGYLVKSEDYMFDYSERIDIPYVIPIDNFNLKDYREYGVIPETVSQYTGLTDKNGVEIYEGDILETCENYGMGECWLKYEVKYNEELAQFILFPVIENGKYNSNNWDTPIYSYHEQAREVIGNIFDEKE